MAWTQVIVKQDAQYGTVFAKIIFFVLTEKDLEGNIAVFILEGGAVNAFLQVYLYFLTSLQ